MRLTFFGAILEDSRTLVMRDIRWWRIAPGTVLYLLVLYVHETVFHVHLFPVWTDYSYFLSASRRVM